MQRTTTVVFNLIIINALVYLAQIILDSSIGLTNFLALYPYNSAPFRPYQLVTSMFAHSPRDFFHIIFNMYALWMFGSRLEVEWGPKRFLIFYLSCGIAAGVAQMVFVQNAPSLGASGAIMGLMGAFAWLYPNMEFFLFGVVAVKAKYLVAGYAAIDLFGGLGQGDNIAHFAHLGGLAMGLILVIIWNKTNRKRFY